MNKTLLIMVYSIALNPVISWAQTTTPTQQLTEKPVMKYHGISPSLEYLSRHPVIVELGMGQFQEDHVEELYEEPYEPSLVPLPTPFVQTTTSKLNAVANTSFEGPGVGLTGFSLTGAPPDHTLAVGPNHIVAWVNSQYAVFDKSGTVLLAPTNGNSLFAGLGNECETTNRGDPILQYDRMAQRWVMSQFAFAVSGGAPVAPYFQCFAVSTTDDPTGTYARYSVQFSATSPSGFNDYGKLGVWPDGYYTSYNMFGGSPAGSNTGVALCASDRVKMLAADPTATTLCTTTGFYAGGASFLPADLDGDTLPSDLTQGGIFMRVSSNQALRYLKLKADFTNSTLTLTDGFGGASGSYIGLPTSFTFACNGGGGTCVAQPGTTRTLDTLGTRLMYRLAFRNRDGVESMVVTHSVDPDGASSRSSALRWYEIRNPLGDPNDAIEANRPFLYQNGTYDPGASGDRWMGSIAMDKYGNMMIGYSVVNAVSGLKPSVGIAGRELNDPLNTLQTEIIAHTGTGSQTGTLSRWGDYSTIQIDPVDDTTFWYIGQYLSTDGTFNWRTRIVSYAFPVAATLNIDDVTITEGNSGTSTADFTITRSHTDDEVSVQVDTDNDTALAGQDFVGITSQIVNFSAGGSATASVSVTINGDTTLEEDEDFAVILSNPTGATLENDTGVGIIENDDSASISINSVTQVEGDSGSSNFVFTVTLSGSVQDGFTVPFSTADGSASELSDYTSNNGTLNFSGTLDETQTITVVVDGESILEGDETFTVTLGTPSNAAVTVSNSTGIGTIFNDDSASISIDDVTLDEGDSGSSNFVFTVSLIGSVQDGFTVPFNTADGSASELNDYTSNSANLNFSGTLNETQTITVVVNGENILEGDETFTVALGTPSNAAVTVSDSSATGIINNDDTASIAINDVTQVEGDEGSSNFVFTVSLNGSVQGGFTVPFNTADGSAIEPDDYIGNSGILNFSGTLDETQTITVQVTGETTVEFDENFLVNLGTPSNTDVNVNNAQTNGTIINDDLFADITLEVSDGLSRVTEGQIINYTLNVDNSSDIIDVPIVNLNQTISNGLINVSWSCLGNGTATCPASGTGIINQDFAIPSNSGLEFTISATVETGAPELLETTFSAVVQAPYNDIDSNNNEASDSNIVVIFYNGFE